MAAIETIARPDHLIPANCHAERVVAVEHYTDRLFRFRITRPASFRFRSGEFVMIGLPGEKPVFRAYSIASPAWDDELEFFSIKVPGGPLTEHLQRIKVGDTILLRQKATGTLVIDALEPGKRLFLISTGTGIAPFASIIRDPATFDAFDEVILTHTCREKAELAYGFDIVTDTLNDPLVGEVVAGKLHHVATTTREASALMGRVTTLIETGAFFEQTGLAPLDPATDRVMLCGSMAMIRDCRDMLLARGFVEGSNARPASFVVERAFVD